MDNGLPLGASSEVFRGEDFDPACGSGQVRGGSSSGCEEGVNSTRA